MDIERRAAVEIRNAGRTLHGVAAPFARPALIGGMFREVIRAGAFAATLRSGNDILALADHRADAVLGRTRSGTLRLTETAAGLEYALELPATSLGNDMLELARRGDLGGVSIGFTTDDEAWSAQDMRELRAVTLHEVSVIQAHAAYGDGTTIALRHRQAAYGPAAARLRQLVLLS